MLGEPIEHIHAQQPVTACGTNLICIDGKVADWNGVASPSYGDLASDAGGGSTDVTAIRITSGNGNLYVRWDQTLTSNKNKISSDGFSITVDTNRDGTPDARGWILFDSAGIATVQVDRPFGTFTTVGSAQQTCNVVACSNGATSAIEASIPLSAFNTTGGAHRRSGRDARQRGTNSSIKDCVPGAVACAGYFELDTDTGIATVDAGHVTTATLACPNTVRNLNQATGDIHRHRARHGR